MAWDSGGSVVLGGNSSIITPGDAVQKSENLADLTDVEQARLNLKITGTAYTIRINANGTWPTRPSPLPDGFDYVIWDAIGKTNVNQPSTAVVGDACDLISGEVLH